MAFLVSSREFGNILRIGLPIFVAQLSQIGMNFVDTIMAGRYAARDLAGVAIAGSWVPESPKDLPISCVRASFLRSS